ncbi:MAG: hypothetical protein LWX07_08330 [Bacteroidetes bacterium]|nr:hypothetical protein [Bacteroidota bacterium]
MIDFTLLAYSFLLDSLIENGREFHTIHDWIEKNPKLGTAIRHDVDRRALNSLRTAELEYSKGIRATYYFRITESSYKPDIMKKIKDMGHEVGYHYEDLTSAGGDFEKAIANFGKNLENMRKTAEIRTIAMHGKPVSKYSNIDLWKKYDYKDYDISGEAYLSLDYSGIYYFSDTGRSWVNRSRSNFKDYTGGLAVEGIRNTKELVKFIRNKRPERIIIMTHPERWNSGFTGFMFYYFRDKTINTSKSILSFLKYR